jgi:hypothetical protein
MPFAYGLTPATAGNLSTNAVANTETDTLFVKAGARDVRLASVVFTGKGAGLTALTAIAGRVCKFGTASTAGTGITPRPADPGAQAAKHTSASRPTAGATRTEVGIVFGCSQTGPGGWAARDQDDMPMLEAAGAPSIDVMDVCGGTALNFEVAARTVE